MERQRNYSVEHKSLKSDDSAGRERHSDPENPPKNEPKKKPKLKHAGFILRSYAQTEYKWKQSKKYAESRLGGPQFKMTENLKVKVPRARNHLLKFITDALRRKKITVSSSFAKCSLVLFNPPPNPLYSLKELPRNFELLPLSKDDCTPSASVIILPPFFSFNANLCFRSRWQNHKNSISQNIPEPDCDGNHLWHLW